MATPTFHKPVDHKTIDSHTICVPTR
jgi:hypothetical protein